MQIQKKITGFTLIELIVVMAIISIIATFLMANFAGVRERSRDATRKSDVSQIRNALEIYRSDEGFYPSTLYPAGTTECTSEYPLTNDAGTVVYMEKIPCDPSDNSAYEYTVSADQLTYTIRACLENDNDAQKAPDSEKGSCAVAAYVLTNP